MAATTTLLGLVTPTQGTLSGTWGDTVNYGITDYVDIAIAGTLSFAGDGAITLANTLGSASGNGITSTTAQYMVIRITGTQSVVKVITGPSYSKLYMVDHAGATSAVTFKAAGQTGVSIAVGEKAFVYYNGTDYVKVAPYFANGVLPVANGGTGQTSFTNGQLLIGNTTGNTLTKATLTAGSGIGITEGAGSITISNTASVAAATPIALGTVYGKVDLTFLNYSIGQYALRYTTTGAYNVALGQQALGTNITGSRNTALGNDALSLNTVSDNTAVGHGALQANSTGTTNAAVGSAALYLNTTGANNTAVGFNALDVNTTGNLNTAVGSNALGASTTAGGNTAIGSSTLLINTTGAQNIAVGSSALAANVTGNSNTAMGVQALTANTADNNTAIGYQAGSAITTGANNTVIGYTAAASSASVSNEVTIGNASVTSFRIPGLSVTWGANTVPFRNIPQSGSAKTTSYTLDVGDVGEFIEVGASGSIVVPDATFAAGDAVVIFNNTSGAITLTMSITTAYIGGTDADKATISLATRGICNVLFISGTVCVVTGNVT